MGTPGKGASEPPPRSGAAKTEGEAQVTAGRLLDEPARHRWIATHILPFEGEVRGWLRRHVHSLKCGDADDLIQESYARLWEADFSAIVNGRSYLYAIVRNLIVEHAERARIVPMERLGKLKCCASPVKSPAPSTRCLHDRSSRDS